MRYSPACPEKKHRLASSLALHTDWGGAPGFARGKAQGSRDIVLGSTENVHIGSNCRSRLSPRRAATLSDTGCTRDEREKTAAVEGSADQIVNVKELVGTFSFTKPRHATPPLFFARLAQAALARQSQQAERTVPTAQQGGGSGQDEACS